VELAQVVTVVVVVASFISVQRQLPMPDQSLLTVEQVAMVLQLALLVLEVQPVVEVALWR
jgi:hypothetical protein